MKRLRQVWNCFRGRHQFVILKTPAREALVCEFCGHWLGLNADQAEALLRDLEGGGK